jgi:hypothetical protein
LKVAITIKQTKAMPFLLFWGRPAKDRDLYAFSIFLATEWPSWLLYLTDGEVWDPSNPDSKYSVSPVKISK